MSMVTMQERMHLFCILAVKLFVCQDMLNHSVDHCFRIFIVLSITLLSQAVGDSTAEFIVNQAK